ncbi:DUF72 domain-containing protein [Nocardia sp. NPDC004860]|uniref:DUF72 domain-containing protein n=1 Tax=Nocardia sp. NPDC004860 TaxID=3154557 RepID=UPI0033B488E1
MTVFAGTSGWQYADWRELVYRRGIGQRRWLEVYAQAFGAVELNAAFYRPVARTTFEGWHGRTPADFVMAVKASRVVTHYRRLREVEIPLERMIDAARGLGDRLGPILIQLPPTLTVEPERLDQVLGLIPAELRVAVEPRHESWWDDRVRAVLEAHRAALCWADRLGRPITPLWRTADWAYVRFHEGPGRSAPRYPKRVLAEWVRRIEDTWDGNHDAYVFFNNDVGGAAVRDAIRIGELFRAAGRPVARTPDRLPLTP